MAKTHLKYMQDIGIKLLSTIIDFKNLAFTWTLFAFWNGKM